MLHKIEGIIGVFGTTSAGKSTLLNSLFGFNLGVGNGETTKDVTVVGHCGGFKIVDVYGYNIKTLMYEEDFSLQGIARLGYGLVCTNSSPNNVAFVSSLLNAGKVRKMFYVHTQSGIGLCNIDDAVRKEEIAFITAMKLRGMPINGSYYVERDDLSTIQALKVAIRDITGIDFGLKTEIYAKPEVLIGQEVIDEHSKAHRAW